MKGDKLVSQRMVWHLFPFYSNKSNACYHIYCKGRQTIAGLNLTTPPYRSATASSVLISIRRIMNDPPTH